jgi:MarR family transcriptional regulator, lower aerobic nicotinate degradation pathway regulator
VTEQAEDMPVLTDLPGHLLRRCHQISVALFLDECAGLDLTPLQFAVLNTLNENTGLDQATIGGLTALDRTTVAVVIGKLEARQLVRRVQSPKDRRSKIVSITERGRRLLAKVIPAIRATQRRITEPLDENETAEFLRLLRKLADANNASSRAPMRRRKG